MMKLKIWQKNILSAIVIVGVGFILFNLAFLLAALVINLTMSIMGEPRNAAPPLVGRVAYLTIVIVISWLVLRSRLNDLVKAAFLTMPLMVLLIILGISFYQQPTWVVALLGAAIIGGVYFYIYRKKLVWYYSFSTLYVAILAFCIMIFRIEI